MYISSPVALFGLVVSCMLGQAFSKPGAAPLKQRQNDCNPLPAGSGPVPSPDTATAFEADTFFSNAALSAVTPTGYNNTFTNLACSNNAEGYMGYRTLDEYDVGACAAICDSAPGCMAFNIYFERDPSVSPGPDCPNPPSTTTIKCVLWGGIVTPQNAQNCGQWRNDFQVVMAGSNGYVNNTVEVFPGWNPPQYLGNCAINAPNACNGTYNTYMGTKIFTGQPFDAALCLAACEETSAYDVAHPTPGQMPQTCQFFNTFLQFENGEPVGQYCAMYTQAWDPSYATNCGQSQGSNEITMEYSYTYTNATAPSEGCPAPTFTGVNVQVYADQTSCYGLPTPTSGLIPLSLDQLNLNPPIDGTLFLADDESQLDYISGADANDITYLFDVTDLSSYLAMVDPNGNSIYLSATGIILATADCSLVIDIEIDNFLQQIAALAPPATPPARRVRKRTETPFTVSVDVTDQCDDPVTDLTPGLSFGPTPCTLVSAVSGTWDWTCNFPGAKSPVGLCEADVNSVLGFLTGGSFGSLTNLGAVLILLGDGLKAVVSKTVLASIIFTAGITVGPEVLGGLAILLQAWAYFTVGLNVIQFIANNVNGGNPDTLADLACSLLPDKGYPLPLTLTGGTSTDVLESLSEDPVVISTTATINDPNVMTCSCGNGGVCYTYQECNDNGNCACGETAEGGSYCFESLYCYTLTACDTSADCPTGTPCLINNCCGYSVCNAPCGAPTEGGGGFLMARNATNGTDPTLWSAGYTAARLFKF